MTAGILDGKLSGWRVRGAYFPCHPDFPSRVKTQDWPSVNSWWAITFPLYFCAHQETDGQIMSYPMSGMTFLRLLSGHWMSNSWSWVFTWLPVSSWWTSCYAFGLVHQETGSQSMSSPMSGMYLKGDPDIGHWTHGESLPAGNGLWLSVTNVVGLLTVSHL